MQIRRCFKYPTHFCTVKAPIRLGTRRLYSGATRTIQKTELNTGPVDHPIEGDGELGRVVMVFSTKGGSGKSVIASNLAVLLAQRSEKPVVLVDADLQFGDVAVMLKLTPQHTIVDAVGSLDRMDQTMLRSLLTEHSPEGLLVLAAPLEPAFADQVGMTRTVDDIYLEIVEFDIPHRGVNRHILLFFFDIEI